MAAYRRVYDSHHLQADCKQPGQLRKPTLGNPVWVTFTFTVLISLAQLQQQIKRRQQTPPPVRFRPQRVILKCVHFATGCTTGWNVYAPC